MIKRLLATLAILSVCASVATAAYTLSPGDLKGVTPQIRDAGVLTPVDLTGVTFWDEELGDIFAVGITDPDNVATKMTVAVPGNAVNGIGWDLVQTSFDPSWGSEQVIAFDTDQNGLIDLTLTTSATGAPIVAEPNSSGGIIKLVDAGIPDLPTSGMVDLYFIDTFEDFPDAADGIVDAGGITIQTIPEPAAMGLMLLAGLSGLFLRRRS